MTGRWVHGHGAVGVGCRVWRLPPSWFRNDWSEVAELMAVGRWFQSLMVQGKKELNRTGWWVCSWCRRCAPLVLGSVLAESDEVDVDQPAADPVQNLESVVIEPTLLKAVVFQSVKQRLDSTRCLVS